MQNELVPVAANWKSIGIALRLKPDVWENIDTQYSDNPCARLTLIVKEWLKRKYNVGKFGEPTWQRLVEVVGHPAGGANMALARRIATKHMAERISSRYSVSSYNRTFLPHILDLENLHEMSTFDCRNAFFGSICCDLKA